MNIGVLIEKLKELNSSDDIYIEIQQKDDSGEVEYNEVFDFNLIKDTGWNNVVVMMATNLVSG